MLSTQSRRLIRQVSPWIAAALLVGASPAGQSQPVARPYGGGQRNPFQEALNLLRRELAAFKLAGKPVVIGLDQGGLVYVPPEVHVSLKELPAKITWISFDGPFTLKALGIAPLDAVRIHSSPSKEHPGLHVATATVLRSAAPGVYHLAVGLASGGAVYVDPDCPPIIIELPGDTADGGVPDGGTQ